MGKREIIYISLHCHHQNDSCIRRGSDESHFKVSLILRDNVTRQYQQTTTDSVGPQTTTFYEEKGETKRSELRSCVKVEVDVLGSRP